MFGQNFQRKYALTDQGVRNTKKGTFWTFLVNLIVMGGMGILYLLMYKLMDTLTEGRPLPSAPPLLGLVVLFVLLSFLTHLQQYKATYGLVYNEVKATRLSLAERLRKLPLGYFGKRDLADLTETLMGDVNRMEHVWSHVLGYLYGSYLSTALIAVCLLVYDWQLAIACLWGVPVAFGLLFGTRRLSARSSERTKKAAVRVSDGIQEALENVREIRATNQEVRYLAGLNQKIDDHEKVTIQGELGTGIFVNAASVIMRLGVATTILVGADRILSGQIDFMLLFLFLLVITRVYAPFDQSLALIAELFVSQVSADRMTEIYNTPVAEGTAHFQPQGHDIVFRQVGFAYDKKKVLDGVSFTAKEGEVTALPETGQVIVATGPLTADALAGDIARRFPGSTALHFYDAAAPLVTFESIDMDSAWFASRYDKGTADYINCPLTQEEYLTFWRELCAAKEAPVHGFEDRNVFEGCMPVEVMARRGEQTLCYGPLKPRGLRDPKTGREPYAVVQLRRDNAGGSIYNLVGFQTHLTWPEQKRVFSLIPALRQAEFVRYGVMHRNTYLDSPRLLDRYYRVRTEPRIVFAGQITGVEGYVESTASGFVAALELARRLEGKAPIDFPPETALGALALYVSNETVEHFQPMNINFGIMPPLDHRVKGKRNKNAELSARSLAIIDQIKQEVREA